MSKHLKKLLFLSIAILLFVGGIFLIRAANNRGSSPYLYMKFDLPG